MEEKDLKEAMERIFLEVLFFRLPTFHENLTAREVPGWDSINHIRLILKIEETFKIKFTIKEIQSLENVGGLLSVVRKKVDLQH